MPCTQRLHPYKSTLGSESLDIPVKLWRNKRPRNHALIIHIWISSQAVEVFIGTYHPMPSTPVGANFILGLHQVFKIILSTGICHPTAELLLQMPHQPAVHSIQQQAGLGLYQRCIGTSRILNSGFTLWNSDCSIFPRSQGM